ncbi:exosortase/archaeosortase family protein [Candidatus Bathyarchaeota archaeon]|nr:exosortase/archaeosortase family protein [Candidatus Bathyarchaeota archaeon]
MFKVKLPAIQQLASVSNVALALKAATVIVAVFALFHQDLSMIFNDALRNEATSHILIIPILFAYLVYRKRRMLRASIPFELGGQPSQTKHVATTCGLAVAAVAVVLYWWGSYTFTPLEYHLLTLPLFTAGLVLTVFNPQTLRQLAFPIFFLIFLTPPPNEVFYGWGSTLSVIGSEVSSAIVNALGVPSVISSEYGNPTIIITRPDQTTVGFTVDIACSGIYSLIGFLVFAAFIAYIIRDRLWKKTTIFLLGLPLIYLFNIARITIILLLGYQYGEELALQIFHLVGGWVLIFLGTLLLLTISEKVFKTQIFSKSPPPHSCARCNSNQPAPTEDYCSNCGRLLRTPSMKLRKIDLAKVAAIACIITIFLSIQAPVLALTKGPAQIIVQTPNGEEGNTQILPQIPGYTLQFDFRDQEFEQQAGQDASLVYEYNIPGKPTVWASIEIAPTQGSLHRWEYCLVTWPETHGYQPNVAQLDLRDVQILQNPPIIARYFAFKYLEFNQTQLVLYWFETSIFTTNNVSETKQVKISLITYPTSPDDVSASEEYLLPFATAIANYWQPMKTWSQIALLISRNGQVLAGATTTMLAAIVVFEIFQRIRTRRTNESTYVKLSTADQQLIRAVRETQGTPTPDNIARAYQNMSGKKITTSDLVQRLNEAEKTGLVERSIINDQDQPILGYRSNVPHPATKSMNNRPKTSIKTQTSQPQTSLKHQKKKPSPQTSNDMQTPDKCLTCPELLQCTKRRAPRNESLIRNCNRNED